MKPPSIDEIHVLDQGDGSGIASYAATYPQAVAAVMRALKDTTGVDVPGILAPVPSAPTNEGGA